MLREIKDQEIILATISQLEILRELLEKNEKGQPRYVKRGEPEKILKGYTHATGKQVQPTLRMLEYGPGEVIMRQGDWGGNTLYVVVDGLLDVDIMDDEGVRHRFTLERGAPFGEMSLLAGVERNATISVPENGQKATVLEISRPALRYLRALPEFGKRLDAAYRDRSFDHLLRKVEKFTKKSFTPEQFQILRGTARFMVYGKHHVLCQEGEAVEKIIFIKDGWVRRVQGLAAYSEMSGLVKGTNAKVGVDYLGAGNCLGLEWKPGRERWPYSAIVMARTEVLELAIPDLLAHGDLLDRVLDTFSSFSQVDDERRVAREEMGAGAVAAEKEIATGIVDGANLLVMDMDLCIRCGNCSLACHHMHGQSRLLRRGINLARPVKLTSKRTQRLLTPQVCMHCQDPECLTGCPTGAIFRGAGGLIDIKLDACIGCRDCADQCPYNVISIVPAEAEAAHTVPDWARFDLLGRLRRARVPAPIVPAVASISQATALPPDVAAQSAAVVIAPASPQNGETKATGKGEVAIKCNLCENTPLNPSGSTRPRAYSCEENCPTGALVRVNPYEYFSEVENAIGIIYRDKTQAIGRNIHKRDWPARLWHLGGALVTLLLIWATVRGLNEYGHDAALAWGWLTMRWATGLFGLAGLLGVMTYPLRKQVYRRRVGALRYWMLAHVYLGAMASAVLWLHGGMHTGGWLTTALHLSFDFVILSGVFGLACYVFIPRLMTRIEGEPLLIEDLVERRAELAQSLADAGAGDARLAELISRGVRPRFLSFGYLLRQYVKQEELSALLAEARAEFKSEAASLSDAASRRKLTEAVENAATLGRVNALVYLHHLLKMWVAPHIISTTLMLALLIAHIAQAIYFSAR
jgi:Fe-S-cluster-containing dehydrogenase component/CRP-like cAMP-binding protein